MQDAAAEAGLIPAARSGMTSLSKGSPDQLSNSSINIYVALRTGQLPSLFVGPERFELKLTEGFYNGATDLISKYWRRLPSL